MNLIGVSFIYLIHTIRFKNCNGFILVDNKFDVLLSRKNCDMTMETRKDEAGEDCQLPDSYHHNSDLYKRYDYTNIYSFQ